MTVSLSQAKKLARSLLVLNKDFGMSWREIAFHAYNEKVNFATLNRIAKSKGAWLPKDEKILIALGLKKAPNPSKAPSWLSERIKLMAARTKTAVMTKAELKREAQEIERVIRWIPE